MLIQCSQCGAKNRVDPKAAQLQQPVCGKCSTLLDLTKAVAEDHGKPVVVTDTSFNREVVDASNRLPVLLDCWAPWCGPCRILAPVLDQLAAEAKGRYRIAKLNTDENPITASGYQIRSIPTLLIFKNGQLVDRLVGVMPKQAIADKLAQFG
jgi:thioredoxin